VARAEDEDFKRFGIIVGGVYVMPGEKLDQSYRNATEPLVGQTNIDSAVAPMVELEYFFFKPGTLPVPGTISAELVLTTTKHDITFEGGAVSAGSLWLLPPSLFVKYHPFATACVSPYFGVGLDVVMPYDERLSIGTTPVHFSVGNAVGWAVKFGFDIPIYKSKCFNLYYNADATYYNTDTNMTIGGLGKYDLDLNPWIVSTGVGIRF
jgi:outer membrane protein